MKGLNVGLAILLGGSALLNVVLLLRRPEAVPEGRSPGGAPSAREAPPSPDVRRELEVERAKTASLEARVKQLESDPAKAASAAPASTDRLASFRAAMRKYSGRQL